MMKSDHFISGSYDKLIIIWKRNQNNQWICQQKLNGHTNAIFCLVLNNNEDLIASGGQDNTINLWQKQNEWFCSQTIKDHTKRVLGLSFNEEQNRLISCGQDYCILIIEQSEQNKQWNVIQKIKVKNYQGVRLCFIDNNTFTLLYPWGRDYMHVFELNTSNKQYSNTKDIPLKIKSGFENTQFPQQYIKSKCIIVNKNASNVNLIRKQQNGEFTIEQSIQFEKYQIFGYMTDDGQYLITWDAQSKEYQIRKYQEQ
ncbi:unnamed protein product [Paramecium pentaurelia]|uniref:WD40-repeat-containing domain n=1 Tax=Paramecium pentaurelia TaxID=43138 RepID=A0A8S1WQ86_9CILI|nr:unnamed protein product [Paramecium pentaurelia]